jgi:glycosyltransferase involved in cell wall biosynthesis
VLPAAAPAQEPGPLILAAGRLAPQKGFDILIRAFALLAGNHPEWRLQIFGEGPQRRDLEDLVRSLGQGGRVALPGWVPDLAAQMAQARIFVLASRWEGFSNALCEAMAAGLACVAADCPGGGPAAIIRQDVDGLLTPPEDAPALARALDRLLSDGELRARLGEQARDVVERFSQDRVLGRWDQCLEQAVARKQGGR